MKANIKFEEIYKCESDAIFRFCLVRVSDREQAMDITQETFMRLWQTISQDKEIFNTRAFLFTVAHRLVIDWYRKKKSLSLEKIIKMMTSEKEIDNEIADEKTFGELEVGAEGRFLIEKLEDLSPGHRDPVYLRFVEGLSPPEIGGILGISANAASVRVNRGLLELRRMTGYDNKENNKE